MTIALGFEILLATLLLLTVFYCWRLDRRLNALRTGQDGMRDAVQDLINATNKAEICIQGLSETAELRGRELDERIISARKLAADLQRLTRLEQTRTSTRSLKNSTPPAHSGLIERLREAS